MIPFFSIITINYNNRDGLERTIKSVIKQNYLNYEYIIVDGLSNDGSIDVINKYANGITKSIIERDKGVFDAQNKGIGNAQGKYLTFLNSGDLLPDENVLNDIYELIDDEDLVYGDVLLDDGVSIVERKYPDHLDFNYWKHDYLCHQVVYYKKEIFQKLGKFDLKYRYTSDHEHLYRIWRESDLKKKHLGVFVAVYDMQGVSANINTRVRVLREFAVIRFKNFPITFKFMILKRFVKALIQSRMKLGLNFWERTE